MSSRETKDIKLDRRTRSRLAAFADGRLGARAEAALEAELVERPELLAAVEEQRRAADAVRRADVAAPARLRSRVNAQLAAGAPARRRRRALAASLAAASVAAAGLAAALTLPGDVPGGPTIVQAAELSQRPASAPAPGQSSDRPGLLSKSAGGVSYPYWSDRFGWQATGLRTDQLGDRAITTVFYERGAQRIGYSIVDGERLAPPVATTDIVVQGVRLRSFLADGRQVVTWVRDGRTCILSGRGIDMASLFELAGWRGHGDVRF